MGQYDGMMHSGRSVTVSGDTVIPVPINYDGSTVQGSVTFFNASTGAFEQVGADGVGSEELIENNVFDEDHTDDWWGYYDSFTFDTDHYNLQRTNADGRALYDVPLKAGEKVFIEITGEPVGVNQSLRIGLHGIDQPAASPTLYIGDGGWQTHSNSVDVVGTGSIQASLWVVNINSNFNFKSISVKRSLPLAPTYDLKDGTYGTIIKLHTAQFTQEDLAFFNEVPERALQWYWGELQIPSGLVKGPDDKVYIPVDGYYLELDYSENEYIQDYLLWAAISNTGNTTTDGHTHIIRKAAGAARGTEYLNGNQSFTTLDAPNRIEFDAIINSGVLDIRNGDSNNSFGFGDIIESGYYNRITIPITSDRNILLFERRDSNESDFTITNLRVFHVLSEYIPIEGTYTYNTRTASGIQTMRLELNDAGVPQSVITNHQVRFRAQGDYVDTGIAIDGSKTDFTMFMGFTLPLVDTGVNQMLVNSGVGLNKLAIMHTTGNPLNELKAQIGQFVQGMTFDETNPIHAMAARYNHATSQLEVAIDGELFSAPFDIVFDGPTNAILFGADSASGGRPFNGYIGEGVLSATMESDTAWQTFWERVQLDECDKNKPAGEYLSNYTFDCGSAGWTPVNTVPSYSSGNVDIRRDGSGSRVEQTVYLEAGDYEIETEVISTSGSGFVFMNPPGESGNNYPLDFLAPGVHTETVTVTASGDYTFGVGANNPADSHTVFGHLSVKASGASIAVSDMDGDGNPDTVLFQSGNVTITEDSDSINIDIDGDGIADLEIPK